MLQSGHFSGVGQRCCTRLRLEGQVAVQGLPVPSQQACTAWAAVLGHHFSRACVRCLHGMPCFRSRHYCKPDAGRVYQSQKKKQREGMNEKEVSAGFAAVAARSVSKMSAVLRRTPRPITHTSPAAVLLPDSLPAGSGTSRTPGCHQCPFRTDHQCPFRTDMTQLEARMTPQLPVAVGGCSPSIALGPPQLAPSQGKTPVLPQHWGRCQAQCRPRPASPHRQHAAAGKGELGGCRLEPQL